MAMEIRYHVGFFLEMKDLILKLKYFMSYGNIIGHCANNNIHIIRCKYFINKNI